jgi:hypothetical protein
VFHHFPACNCKSGCTAAPAILSSHPSIHAPQSSGTTLVEQAILAFRSGATEPEVFRAADKNALGRRFGHGDDASFAKVRFSPPLTDQLQGKGWQTNRRVSNRESKWQNGTTPSCSPTPFPTRHSIHPEAAPFFLACRCGPKRA